MSKHQTIYQNKGPKEKTIKHNISEHGVVNTIRKLRNRKTPAEDTTPNDKTKHAIEYRKKIITILNNILQGLDTIKVEASLEKLIRGNPQTIEL